jgi:hypothetical protein
MLIEYTFSTSLDGPAALKRAAELLIPFGFVAGRDRASEATPTHVELEMLRSSATWRRPADVRRWPHSINLTWDAGRVTVGASMPPASKGVDASLGKITDRQADAIKHMLEALAKSLESLLTGALEPAAAQEAFRVVDQQIADEAQTFARRKALMRFVLIVAIAIMLLGWFEFGTSKDP